MSQGSMNKPELTRKQRRFFEEYLVDLNATQAAIRAGYKVKAAYRIGYENLNKPQVAVAIDREMKARSERCQVTADRVLQEYARIAFSDLRNYAGWNREGVYLKASSKLHPDEAAAVQEISRSPTGAVKVKLHDKGRALDALAKHLGLTKEPTDLLEVLLAALPHELSRAVRDALAGQQKHRQ